MLAAGSLSLFRRIVLFTAQPNSEQWETCWLMYELYARRLSSVWSVPEASVSGRTRKKAESKEEHDRRLESYVEMERRRRERYDAPLEYESDDEEGMRDEKQQVEAEQPIEELEDREDSEGEEDKENRPPDAVRSFPWDSEWMAVQRMAEEAEQRKRQRGCR